MKSLVKLAILAAVMLTVLVPPATCQTDGVQVGVLPDGSYSFTPTTTVTVEATPCTSTCSAPIPAVKAVPVTAPAQNRPRAKSVADYVHRKDLNSLATKNYVDRKQAGVMNKAKSLVNKMVKPISDKLIGLEKRTDQKNAEQDEWIAQGEQRLDKLEEEIYGPQGQGGGLKDRMQLAEKKIVQISDTAENARSAASSAGLVAWIALILVLILSLILLLRGALNRPRRPRPVIEDDDDEEVVVREETVEEPVVVTAETPEERVARMRRALDRD